MHGVLDGYGRSEFGGESLFGSGVMSNHDWGDGHVTTFRAAMDQGLSNPFDQAIDASAMPAGEPAAAEPAFDVAAFSFDGPDMAASNMMEALLIMGDAAAVPQSSAMLDGGQFQEAIADVMAEHVVDALVGHFADLPTGAPVEVADIDPGHLSAILGVDLGGPTTSMVFAANDVPVDDGGEHALVNG